MEDSARILMETSLGDVMVKNVGATDKKKKDARVKVSVSVSFDNCSLEWVDFVVRYLFWDKFLDDYSVVSFVPCAEIGRFFPFFARCLQKYKKVVL